MGSLRRAIDTILNGGVVAIPTDTVYGLIGNALDENAVRKIYHIKKRPLKKPLVLFARSIDEAAKFAEFTEEAYALGERFWPGPLTLVLKAKPEAPKLLVTDKGTIGIRIPNDELVMMLLEALHVPLASTSANISGMPPARTSKEVIDQLNHTVDFIVMGTSGGAPPSTVLDMSGSEPIILRKGPISIFQIENLLNREVKLSPQLDLNVLFVCTGNIYRSQIAAAVLQHLLPQNLRGKVNIDSAGTSAVNGAPVPSEVVRVLNELGITAGDRRSKRMTPQLLENSDLIYVMERRHLEKLEQLNAAHKATLLSEEDIPDPVGRGYPFVKLVANGIKALIENRILPYISRKF